MIRPSFVFGVTGLVAVTVPMAMVHEDMHQWTGKQQEEWQEAQHMETVLINN
jgi:hypothetical protein